MIDVLYLTVTNKDWFQLSLKTIQQHLLNYGKIYVLQTSQDLTQFKDLSLFTQSSTITQKVLVIEQNMGLLKDVDINYIPITYDFINNQYIQDHTKPQLVNTNSFFTLFNSQNTYPLTQYFRSIDRVGIPNSTVVVNVIKPICCNIKSLLTIKSYVNWNQKGFESLKKYLNK